MSKYAVVQNLGLSAVVFGLGESRESAEADALREGGLDGLDGMATVEVSDEQAEAIAGGKVEWRNGELPRA